MGPARQIAVVPVRKRPPKFFEDLRDEGRGKDRRGVTVSDGVMNVALLKQEWDEKVGIYHYGHVG